MFQTCFCCLLKLFDSLLICLLGKANPRSGEMYPILRISLLYKHRRGLPRTIACKPRDTACCGCLLRSPAVPIPTRQAWIKQSGAPQRLDQVLGAEFHSWGERLWYRGSCARSAIKSFSCFGFGSSFPFVIRPSPAALQDFRGDFQGMMDCLSGALKVAGMLEEGCNHRYSVTA